MDKPYPIRCGNLASKPLDSGALVYLGILILTLSLVGYPRTIDAGMAALYGDFSTVHLDPIRWASPRESIRRIQDGVLVLAHSGSASSDNASNTSLRHLSPPTNLTSLQADVTLTAATRGFPRIAVDALRPCLRGRSTRRLCGNV
jgi:hypothetical protein